MLRVDLHGLEEGVDGASQAGHGAHGVLEALGLHGRRDLGLGRVEGLEQRALLGLAGEPGIGAEGVLHAVARLGLGEDVVGTSEALDEVLAVRRVDERLERLGAADEEGEVVLGDRGAGPGERGVDDVVADAAVAQVDLEAVVEEGEEVSRSGFCCVLDTLEFGKEAIRL